MSTLVVTLKISKYAMVEIKSKHGRVRVLVSPSILFCDHKIYLEKKEVTVVVKGQHDPVKCAPDLKNFRNTRNLLSNV